MTTGNWPKDLTQFKPGEQLNVGPLKVKRRLKLHSGVVSPGHQKELETQDSMEESASEKTRDWGNCILSVWTELSVILK